MLNFDNKFFINSTSNQLPNPDLERQMKHNFSQYQCYLAKCETVQERKELTKTYKYFKKTISVIDTIETMIVEYNEAYNNASYFIRKEHFRCKNHIEIIKIILDLIYDRRNSNLHNIFLFFQDKDRFNVNIAYEREEKATKDFFSNHEYIINLLYDELEDIYMYTSLIKKYNPIYIFSLFDFIKSSVLGTAFNYGRESPYFYQIFDIDYYFN